MKRAKLEQLIFDAYGVCGEYPWGKHPTFAVYRHTHNRKWFAVVMELSQEKLGLRGEGNVCVVNLKCDPILIGSLLEEDGIFPGYHMNKNHWISVLLDEAEQERLKCLLAISFDKTK